MSDHTYEDGFPVCEHGQWADQDMCDACAGDDTTYAIYRFRFQEGREGPIRTGLTLEEAQEHCNDEATHGPGWFDGYEEES